MAKIDKIRHKVFGIRHHGPGSALHLADALESYQPDCILIECPDETQAALDALDTSLIELPVALLLYRQDNSEHNMVLPMTEFSPEWVAIQYAKRNALSLMAIDLPLGALVMNPEELMPINPKQKDLLPVRNTGEAFLYLAGLQGFDEIDLWWEMNFESVSYDTGFFQKIIELMEGIRPAIEAGSTKGNRMREAWMRNHIRKSIRQGFTKIAVVCGAAHALFLMDLDAINKNSDAKLIREVQVTPMLTNWIPWSYHKISSLNHYNAGVPYPLFYEHLFRYKEKATITITAALTIYLRTKGYDISPAHTIEAVTLAQTMAQLRGFSQPGIQIIIEACNAVYNLDAKGFDRRLIEEAFIGEKTGKVPVNTVNQALIADFEKLVKQYSLKTWIQKTGEQEVTFDLRQDKAHGASKLLWRLLLLDIPWGNPAEPFKATKGTFNEYWILHWQPDYMIHLFHLIMYGTTIKSAAHAKTVEVFESHTGPEIFLKLFKIIINAEIPSLTDILTEKIQNTLFEPHDMEAWLDLIPELISVSNFGSVRGLNTSKIADISRELMDKIIVSLASTLVLLHTDNVDTFLKKLKKIQHALFLHADNDEYLSYFQRIDTQVNNFNVPAQIQGWTSGICLKSGLLSSETVMERLSYELSDIDHPENAAHWLEGLLSTQVFSALQIPDIIEILNYWLVNIQYEQFRNILPALRKAFAQLSSNNREQLLAFVNGARISNLYNNQEIQFDQTLVTIFQRNIDWIIQKPGI